MKVGKAERRDAQRRKARQGMRVSGRKALLLQSIINQKAKEAKEARRAGTNI